MADVLASIGVLGLLYAVLLSVFAFGIRHWFIRASRTSP